MMSRKKEQLIRDVWHIRNVLYNFTLDYEDDLIIYGIELDKVKDALKVFDQINEEVKK